MEFETFVIIVAVVVIVLIATASTRRRGLMHQRLCGSCGASHPPFAQFCRRCGQRL